MRNTLRAAGRLALTGSALAAGLLLAPARVSAAAPADKALPASTVGVIQIENAAEFRKALDSSQFGRLVADPALKPIRDDVEAKMADGGKKLKDQLGVTIKELLTLPTGRIVIAAVAKPDNEKSPVAILITADAGTNADKMADVMGKATDLAKKDAEVTTEEFKGGTLTIIKSKKEDEKDNPPMVWTRQGTVFHIGSDTDAVKDLLSHADGREDSLSSGESYSAIRKKSGDAQLTWFLDIGQILKLAANAGGGGNAGQVEAQLQLTGLNGLKGIGGGLSFNTGDFDSLNKIIIHNPGPAQGLMKIFSLPKAALKPEAWVPGDTSAYQTISWDLQNAYNAVNDLVDMFAPGTLQNIEKQIGGPDGGGISFQKDVFGPLANRISVISDMKQSKSSKNGAAKKDGEPENPGRTVIGVALKDEKAFQTTFNKMLSLAGNAPKKREFQGTTIYDFDLPEIPNAGAGAPQLQGPMSVAISKGTLFLSTEPTLLEQVLRGGGQPLTENPAYQAISKHFPAQVSTLSFSRPEEQARAAYELLKSGQFKKQLEEAMKNAPNADKAPDASKVGDLIDPAKLPDFEVFAKYLSASGGYGVGDEEGFTITQFTIKKANP